jgi:hypothetical protein
MKLMLFIFLTAIILHSIASVQEVFFPTHYLNLNDIVKPNRKREQKIIEIESLELDDIDMIPSTNSDMKIILDDGKREISICKDITKSNPTLCFPYEIYFWRIFPEDKKEQFTLAISIDVEYVMLVFKFTNKDLEKLTTSLMLMYTRPFNSFLFLGEGNDVTKIEKTIVYKYVVNPDSDDFREDKSKKLINYQGVITYNLNNGKFEIEKKKGEYVEKSINILDYDESKQVYIVQIISDNGEFTIIFNNDIHFRRFLDRKIIFQKYKEKFSCAFNSKTLCYFKKPLNEKPPYKRPQSFSEMVSHGNRELKHLEIQFKIEDEQLNTSKSKIKYHKLTLYEKEKQETLLHFTSLKYYVKDSPIEFPYIIFNTVRTRRLRRDQLSKKAVLRNAAEKAGMTKNEMAAVADDQLPLKKISESAEKLAVKGDSGILSKEMTFVLDLYGMKSYQRLKKKIKKYIEKRCRLKGIT